MGENRAATATVVHTVSRSRFAPSKSDHKKTTEAEPRIQHRLMTAVTNAAEKQVAVESVLAELRDALSPALICYMGRDPSQTIQAPSDVDVVEQMPPGAPERLRQWADESCKTGGFCVGKLSGANSWTVVTVPVILKGRPPEVICAAARSADMDTSKATHTLQLAASHITLWCLLHQVQQATVENQNMSALLDMLSRLNDCRDLNSAHFALVNDLCEYLGCRRIALGITRTGRVDCKVVAVSGLGDFDARGQFNDELESVLNESLLRDGVTIVGNTESSCDEGTRAHQVLRDSSGCETLITAPLLGGQGEVVGAWLLEDARPAAELGSMVHFVRTSQIVIGSRLRSLRQAAEHPIKRLMTSVLRLLRTRKMVVGVSVIALAAAILCIPMNYKVRCDCQLEPVSRRFVAAPYDGTLRQSLVEAGEIVTTGQVLARMDARELQWELSGLEADYESERKKKDAAAARDEVALAQQSSLEMQRLEVKMQLLRHRLDNLEVKSPIDGVVIAGDLKKSEGAPLSIGQAMFEIGPLKQMIVEVAIPERDILHVKEGMQVEIRLDAARHDRVVGPIARIAPRAELRENNSVYIAEVELPDQESTRRPGMKGSAKVISDPHPLGWNLFHKTWESLAMMIGS